MAEKIPVEVTGIDPRLDNRTGDQRPQQNQDPKPQQIDGPDALLELKQVDDKADDKAGAKADDKQPPNAAKKA